MEKRNSRRFRVALPIAFTGSERGIGIVRNISRGGCQMDCMTDISARESLVMHLTLSPDDAPLIIQAASIRRCNDQLFSVAFLVMDTKEQERLSRFLSKLEEKEPRYGQ